MTGSTSDSELDGLHKAMAARVAKGELPGLVMLVAHGSDVHVDTIGVTALGSDDPMRRDTIFRIASMTKPILAAATMMLVEDGRLALDEPVDRLLPELADRQVLKRIDGPLDETVPADRPITVEDLLTFRMGYGMIFEPSLEPPYPIITAANELELVMGPPDPPILSNPDEWIRRFGTLPLMDQPGQRWRYNAGSLVLGVLVARASGLPLADFLRTRIFEPLGMTETGFFVPVEQSGRLPSCYMTDFQTGKTELVTSPASGGTAAGLSRTGARQACSRPTTTWPSPGCCSTRGPTGDERLLSEKSVLLMTANHLTAEQMAGAGPVLRGRGWGFGMSVVTAPDEVSAVPGRYGLDGGRSTTWFNDPNRNLVAIAMTQTVEFLFNGALAEFERLAAGS